jgi:quaternary ammonium compound-resistance protein SugE
MATSMDPNPSLRRLNINVLTVSFIYLLVASVFQLAWLYNMKRIKKGIWASLKKGPVFSLKTLQTLLPIFLYLVFGISNVVFLTWSMQTIPSAIAYAIWTGIVIGAAAIIDQLISKKPLQPAKVIFIGMILLGIIGLRLSTT